MNPERSGMLLMAVAAIGFTVSDVSIKVIGANLSAWQISTVRGLVGIGVALMLVNFNYRQFFIPQWRWQILMGLSGAIGSTCHITSIKYLPLTIAVPLCFTYPALAALLSPIINKEKPTNIEWIAIALAFVAVICFSWGAPSEQKGVVTGLFFGFGGVIGNALLINLARRQAQQVPMSVNLFYLYMANLVVCLPLVLIFDSPVIPSTRDLAYLFLLIAPSACFAYVLTFLAYRHISAHRGGVILTFEAALASIFGILVLGEPATFLVISGGIIMMVSSVIIARSRGALA